GAKNAPIFRGGGHAHNRLPRDYSHELTKKFRALALRHALSARANAGDIIVIDALTVKDGKTAALQKSMTNLKLEKALFIAGDKIDVSVARAARNLAHVDILPNAGLNVYDVLRAGKVVLTQDAVKAIHERFKGTAAPKAKKTKEGAAA
ncbi:MAG: 50S ribosomal protein L4, partial [Terricaulis sp.]